MAALIRQQIRLVSHLGNRGYYRIDTAGFFAHDT